MKCIKYLKTLNKIQQTKVQQKDKKINYRPINLKLKASSAEYFAEEQKLLKSKR